MKCATKGFPKPKISLGQIVLTRSVNSLTKDYIAFAKFVWACLAKHTHGDWGDVDREDKRSNDRDVREGGRILSAYTVPAELTFPPSGDWPGDAKLWIITEGDRSATTVLWPSEY